MSGGTAAVFGVGLWLEPIFFFFSFLFFFFFFQTIKVKEVLDPNVSTSR